jgi:hypothetical protein
VRGPLGHVDLVEHLRLTSFSLAVMAGLVPAIPLRQGA